MRNRVPEKEPEHRSQSPRPTRRGLNFANTARSTALSLMGLAVHPLAALIIGALVTAFAAQPVNEILIPAIMSVLHHGKVIYLYDAELEAPYNNKDAEKYLLLFPWSSEQPSGRMIEITENANFNANYDYIVAGIHREDLLSFTFQKRDETKTSGGGAFVGHNSQRYPNIYVGTLTGMVHEEDQTTCRLGFYWAVAGDALQIDDFLEALNTILADPNKKQQLRGVSMYDCRKEDKKPA